MIEQLRPYMCKHFIWKYWNHYGQKMPELGCKLKGGYMGSCQGICTDFDRKEKFARIGEEYGGNNG